MAKMLKIVLLLLVLPALCTAHKTGPKAMTDELWCALSKELDGVVVLPDGPCEKDGPEFDELNAKGFIYCRTVVPSVVIAVMSTRDVAKVVRLLATRHLDFRVRSGGHSSRCDSFCDGCVVIDMQMMKRAEKIEKEDGRVFLGVEAGATLLELFDVYQGSGYFVPHGSCGPLRLGGHVAGGGVGTISRLYGLTVDYVVGVEMVTPNGHHIRVFDPTYEKDVTKRSPSQTSLKHQELLWAVRGNGHANFGIVTKYWFRTEKQPKWVVRAFATYLVPTGGDVLHSFRAFCKYFGEKKPRGSNRMIVWPVLLPGDVGRLNFLFYYVAKADSAPEALAEAAPEVEKFLAEVPMIPAERLLIYPMTFESFIYGLLTDPDLRVDYTCAVRSAEKAIDLCSNEMLEDVAEQLAYELKKENFAMLGHTVAFAYLEPWGGNIPHFDPYFQWTSLGVRHIYATLTYCRVTFPGVPREALLPKVKEWDEKLAKFGEATYINYLGPFTHSRRQVYPVQHVWQRLQHVKTQYDPSNIFHSEWGVTPIPGFFD